MISGETVVSLHQSLVPVHDHVVPPLLLPVPRSGPRLASHLLAGGVLRLRTCCRLAGCEVRDASDELMADLVKLHVAHLLLVIAGHDLDGWLGLGPVPEVKLVEGGNDQESLHWVEGETGNDPVSDPEL